MGRLGSYKFKQEKTDGMFGQYRFKGNPLREGSNSNGFILTIHADGMYGCYIDHGPSGERGSLWQFAKELGIEYQFNRKQATKTKKGYSGLADYAETHGLTADDLTLARWSECVHQGRSALKYPTKSGNRIRYIDGGEGSPYTNEHTGYKACWYGLERAISVIKSGMAFSLVIANGECSTIVGQKWMLAACCVTGGEKGKIPDYLITELQAIYPGGEIILALDCDYAGINSTMGLIEQFETAGFKVRYADLGFDQGGDLADFCRLFENKSEEELQTRAAAGKLHVAERKGLTTFEDASERVGQLIRGERFSAPPLPLPFKNLRQFGGMGRMWYPGRAVVIGADTGGGKTICLETLIDFWRQLGINGAIWTPEWSDEEQVQRAIQRGGGPSLVQQIEHNGYLSAIAAGVPENKIFCERLDDDQVELAERIRDRVTNRDGHLHIVGDRRAPIEKIVEQFEKAIANGENEGKPVTFVIIDYAQLMHPEDASRFGSELSAINESFSIFCDLLTRKQLVGVVTSQVVKDDAKTALKGNTKLTQHSMLYLRTLEANFVMTLTRQMNNKDEYTDIADVVVGKNNLGKLGKTMFELIPSRGCWQDARVEPVDLTKIGSFK